MIAESAISFIMMASITFTDGSELTAYGDNFPSVDACMVQAEHDVKLMSREVETIEAELPRQVIREIRITCDPVGGAGSDSDLTPAWEVRYVR